MDGSIKIWDSKFSHKRNEFVETFKKVVSSMAGVRSAKWSITGESIFTGDFECNLKSLNVDTGKAHYVINAANNSEILEHIGSLYRTTRSVHTSRQLHYECVYPPRRSEFTALWIEEAHFLLGHSGEA